MTEHPDTSEFFQFFQQCLEGEKVRPAVEGLRDPQLVSLANTIMTNPRPFTVVDYGCGRGRFIQALQNLTRFGRDVLARMHYIGVDSNYDYLEQCEHLATQTGLASQLRRFELAPPDLFELWTRAADYVFFINTIHEISVLHLDGVLEECLFKLKPGGCIVIHELRQLLSGEKDFITYDEDDIRFLFSHLAEQTIHITCNVFSFESKRRRIPMFNAYIIKGARGFVSRNVIFLEVPLREMLERKQARIAKALADCGAGDTREYAHLIALQANIATSLLWLKINADIWAGKPVPCVECDSDAVHVEVSPHDEELEGKIARLSCPRCGMSREMVRWDLRRAMGKDHDMLSTYYQDEYTRRYHHAPPREYSQYDPTWREWRAALSG